MITETVELLDKMICPNKYGIEYLVLNGSDHKVWLLPVKCLESGLQIYQPGSLKGRIIKSFLPYIKKIKPVLKKLNITYIRFNIKDNVKDVLNKVIGNNTQIIYAFYVGNTIFENNRKVVIQVSIFSHILGYAKFTTEKSVSESFETEISILTYLHEKKIYNVPKVIWKGNIEGLYGFIQNTEKIGNEPVILNLENRHWKFLIEINQKTGGMIDFQNSEYESVLYELATSLRSNAWKCKDELLTAIELVKTYYKTHKMKVAFFHGDFTPWNICIKQDHIFVFDFEYAQMMFPEWMDAFHFITQVGIMTENLSGDAMYIKFKDLKNIFNQYMDNPDFQYLCYLLYIVCFYYRRWKGRLSENERSCQVWIQLVRKCCRNLEDRS